MTNREWIIEVCNQNDIHFNEKYMILYKHHNTESPLDYDEEFDTINLEDYEIYLSHRLHNNHLLVYYYSKVRKQPIPIELYSADGVSFAPVMTETPIKNWNDRSIKSENINLLRNKL